MIEFFRVQVRSPDSEYTLPNMMHFVRTFSIRICVLKTQGLLLSKRFKIIKKLYLSKT